ncbi:hypothetical protein H310_06387 [Aphanomyces invadans]|uniref:Secreted protein n=1 Tax=Aphanomyces invadans TaxID=157072 RepID=A0A024U5Y1_9STRA|nr:hypothetical protein H310_06387 [Aphanomyces invadans]ETW01811.1 hypothetical protein H310_06387 [Aphanomyces invadans]|eukprot:XP_008869659.1 hypothetical protein H310_06387 [Aphanomyces invadans]
MLMPRWMIATGMTMLLATHSSAQLVDVGPPVLPDVLSTLLDAYKPLLSGYAQANLPATIGNCKEGNAPSNCTNVGNLYEVKETFYHVKARWISGLNTMRLDDVAVKFDESSGAMTLSLKLYFAQLPASLLVEACAGSLGCAKFLDSTKTCCGTAKTVAMTATAKCSERAPFLHAFAISDATILPGISLTIDVMGHTFEVADITKSVIQGVKDSAGNFLATQGMDLINSQLQSVFGDKVYCSRASRDAETPPVKPITMPPTMTPVPETPATVGPTRAVQTSNPTTTVEPSTRIVATTTMAPPTTTENLDAAPPANAFTNRPGATRPPLSSTASPMASPLLFLVAVLSLHS